ncbi:hypothetical protein R6Q59_019747 [Mikania micrantha]|uniref:J domain-containing protein n=1 Tax=Mikania micrantha TaxID=192012 RepID=A0A5N6PRC7_9ASTR|nr:hypothetical protein E3N88_07369 [Mikania micrantha]
MECNKEEAIRAKTIAEKKFADKDFTGAKKFTLKSQNLYPGLDGISQMLITFNVYIASETKINGESDWYGVLDVKPSDDDETIRKQYRKLVLMLHPDKNKSVGADGAFKILSEAWKLLSDKSKRSVYDQRRKLQQSFTRQRTCSSPWSSPSFVNVVHKATSMPTGRCSASGTTTQTPPARVPPRVPARAQTQTQAKARVQTRAKTQVQAQTPPLARVPPPDTFWTICYECKMHYEYYKMFMNKTIICRKCQKPLHAVEMRPANMPKPGALYGKTDFRSTKPEVHLSTASSGAPKAASYGEKVNMYRTCEEFNAQRLSKRRKD